LKGSTGSCPKSVISVRRAAASALALGRRIQERQATLLANRLDAAYQYHKALCDVVTTGSYNFEKNDGDWRDYQLLFYLCDPTIILVTDDGRLRKRVGESSQRERIPLLRDFLKSLGFTPRH